MLNGMGRGLVLQSSHTTNRYFIPNWGIIVAPYVGAWIETIKAGDKGALLGCRSLRPDFINASP